MVPVMKNNAVSTMRQTAFMLFLLFLGISILGYYAYNPPFCFSNQ